MMTWTLSWFSLPCSIACRWPVVLHSCQPLSKHCEHHFLSPITRSALSKKNRPPRVEADDGGAILVHGVEERVDDVAHRATVPQQLLEPAHHNEDIWPMTNDCDWTNDQSISAVGKLRKLFWVFKREIGICILCIAQPIWSTCHPTSQRMSCRRSSWKGECSVCG